MYEFVHNFDQKSPYINAVKAGWESREIRREVLSDEMHSWDVLTWPKLDQTVQSGCTKD